MVVPTDIARIVVPFLDSINQMMLRRVNRYWNRIVSQTWNPMWTMCVGCQCFHCQQEIQRFLEAAAQTQKNDDDNSCCSSIGVGSVRRLHWNMDCGGEGNDDDENKKQLLLLLDVWLPILSDLQYWSIEATELPECLDDWNQKKRTIDDGMLILQVGWIDNIISIKPPNYVV